MAGEAAGRPELQFNDILRESHPDYPGWYEWRVGPEDCFNRAVLGTLLVRPEGDTQARVRIHPKPIHRNLSDNVHGGIILALVDVALFAGSTVASGRNLVFGVTVEVNTHFVGAGDIARPLDAVVEVVRETGRMVFARGTVVQGDDVVAGFSGILRKLSRQ